MDKLILILICAGIDCCHHLEESVLENVVGHILVLHHGENIAIDLGLITGKENIKTGGVAVPITLYQLVVRERAKRYINHSYRFLRV